METCTEFRPNGKIYRAQKSPKAHYISNGWCDEDCVLVVRVARDSESTAQELAATELSYYDDCILSTGHFGWWRKAVRDHENTWVYDSVRGVPGWIFEVE